MLDLVLVVVVLLLTATTLLYSFGCQKLWENDTTRETAPDEPIGSPRA